jgi:hypothetical protein
MEVTVVGGEPVAADGAKVLRNVAPGNAADNTVTAVTTDPRRTIGGALIVIVVIAILHPLPLCVVR